MMKRRGDEMQFSGRSGGSRPHTTQNGALGPPQYQTSQGVLKTNVSESTVVVKASSSPDMQYSPHSAPYHGSPMGTIKTSQSPVATATIHSVNPSVSSPNSMRHMQQNIAPMSPAQNCQTGQEKFQRLKVEDALSYLDQVKYKFGNQPQVYNDFLDIMKEFKSQSIDTPGVIQRVSNLFKGHPELIVGFNTFLPPGYKIEVQANDQGVAFQVSVSMPSPSGGSLSLQQPTSPHRSSQIIHTMPTTVITPQHPQSIHVMPTQQVQPVQPLTTTTTYNVLARERDRPSDRAITVASVGPNPSPPITTTIQTATINEIANQGQNLHHISQAHQSIIQAEQAGGQQSQPVEFNHAISYVNKIKLRFQSQPEKYKRFLEILHAYQKEQKVIKEGSGQMPSKQLTEAEVYSQVAKLFDQQEDLLREFGQFLPDATSHTTTHLFNRNQSHTDYKKLCVPATGGHQSTSAQGTISRIDREYDKDYHRGTEKDRSGQAIQKYSSNLSKRSPSQYNLLNVNPMARDRDGPSPPKRYKPIYRDVTLAEASKYGSLNDFAFFDKVRKALRNPEVYDNFLRCLILFNQEIVSRVELVGLISPFLNRFPELQRWFQEFLGSQTNVDGMSISNSQRQDRNQGELAQEIDLSTCKRLGASYCALPKSSEVRKCSGRTNLCREVLNDTWVSFPTWAEDSTFVTSRKTQYEEIIYRCEDERFELDVVIETNSSTIRVLEGVHKKMSRMSQEELAKFRLDDCLGGTSPTIHQRALRRVYGDKVHDIIQGLKNYPHMAVSIVLKRLKAKDEEWREAQKGFNKQWREQNEKYYLKSLDHQGINFKQNDVKALRSKSLLNEIESLFDERHEQNEDGNSENTHVRGPHLILTYKDKTVLDDAANLLIHHVKRQTGIQKQEKTRIKQILRHFVPDLFFWPRQQLSDDEREDDDKDMDVDPSTGPDSAEQSTEKPDDAAAVPKRRSSGQSTTTTTAASTIATTTTTTTSTESSRPLQASSSGNSSKGSNDDVADGKPEVTNISGKKQSTEGTCEPSKVDAQQSQDHVNIACTLPDESYTLFFANTNWYLFLRLHAILCERLRTIYDRAQILAIEEKKSQTNRRENTATALRLKPSSEIQVEDYYTTFLDMLKNVLDGNMDGNSYEDSLREMFGIHAYMAFTLDRLVSNAVRQLQNCVTEKGAIESMQFFHQEQRRNGAGGLCRTANRRVAAELAYQKRSELNLQDENCFKILIYKIECRVTIELLDTESDDKDKAAKSSQSWNNYIEGMKSPKPTSVIISQANISDVKPDDAEAKAKSFTKRKQLFLNRNIRLFKERNNVTAAEASLIDSTVERAAATEARRQAEPPAREITESTESTASTNQTKDGAETSGTDASEPRIKEEIGDDRYFVNDREEMNINIQSYRMVFVVNKDAVFYKQNALRRARQTHPKVTSAMYKKFNKYNSEWVSKHVSDAAHNVCTEWFMGRSADLVPTHTHLQQENDANKTPYRIHNRYRVHRINN